jgi:hypothetical protein
MISGTEPHGKRLIVKGDDLLTAFLSLERDVIAPKGANGNATRQNVAWEYAYKFRDKGEFCSASLFVLQRFRRLGSGDRVLVPKATKHPYYVRYYLTIIYRI